MTATVQDRDLGLGRPTLRSVPKPAPESVPAPDRVRARHAVLVLVQAGLSGAAALAVGLLRGAGPVTGLVLGVWLAVVCALSLRSSGLTSSRSTAGTGVLASLGAVALLVVATPVTEAALAPAFWMVAAAALVLVAARAGLGRWVRPLRVLVVGQDQAYDLASEWADRSGLEVRDVLDTTDHLPAASGTTLADIVARRAVEQGVDAVAALAPSPAQVAAGAPSLRELGWALESTGVRLLVPTGVDGVDRHRVDLHHVGGTVLAHVTPSRPSAAVLAVKDVVDRLGAAVLLVVLAPVLLALVVVVRLDSAGAAVFRQTRVGQQGRPFTIYKLRTMRADAELAKAELRHLDDGHGLLFKVRQDPRVTRIGRFLRTTSLDELPQLVNVLRGEMSLVGPRPALPEEVAAYSPTTRRRLAVRPGMTGLWQVRGRSDLDWDQAVSLDLDYTDNITIRRDLAICLSTLRVVVSGKGAY